ncbi:membrane protein insertase YidC [Ponticoccus sp. SC2-23]|uniref:membrane protein insertase YidC n=1 Tax=Alexandriicola marinus TaxID=2081710 RepID=UPI000FD9018D|nr:membrane protein insertase YidC [Alexandriicola marinus]MBM1222074.1 membrane protein insertase YidC [Ponticoccus sp. SC6-9]MBM1226761.1 membrane protein insertase YidC [Ponticoccus sp. SC6-15]MBM1231021.1 membrane protein insertase YidC [Ponticoccus sp. SC6-38]MBM1235727.1 membrane protein insertase YidC [Ponticoccus sp. SC6-45]MBM1240043.1 membrane protein insertase YidC [Ponticoccus sp. SC6-49]MBM1244397.1 membrane protein insertase YidC [Ponticoccus sp. SC2-64]MBM1249201.1 membrane pr
MDDQNRNLILATALSFLVILTWFILFPPEEQTPLPSAEEISTTGATPVADAPEGVVEQGAAPQVEAAPEAARLDIATSHLTGSISLQGGRIDDLLLATYRETLDPNSDLVRLLSPVGSNLAYYALYGWAPTAGMDPDMVPGPNTIWSVEAGETLTADSPVTLVWDNGEGLVFRRTMSVDEDYLFTISQSVENTTGESVAIAPYGLIARHGQPDSRPFFILHEGVVRMSDGELQEITYKNLPDMDPDPRGLGQSDIIEVSENGWIGFTDKYWMTTLVPEPGTAFRSTVRYNATSNIFQSETVMPTRTIGPGETVSAESQLFAGAKEWEIIREYETEGGIEGFLDSIDWGWFFFLTKPIFALLHWLNIYIGNMGWSIIVLTLIIKAVLLPLAYKSYVSMAKMKELQPEMEKLKEQAGDDRQKMQQGMMELYKKNKVNPASGCLPILMQIPIFFSLYKVIFVTIELRHAPWIGWIKDLSAPDPSSILNLFGLLPWGTPDQGSIFFIFSLGVLPIFLGISMWLQQKLNPAPTDATQKMIFAWMPWVFMFMLGSFASGLVLYWIANNTITFTQQYLIMRSHGHKPDVFGNILSGFKRDKKAAANSADAPKKGK